jgi:hypothetical protein
MALLDEGFLDFSGSHWTPLRLYDLKYLPAGQGPTGTITIWAVACRSSPASAGLLGKRLLNLLKFDLNAR